MSRADQLLTELSQQIKRFYDESEKHKSLHRKYRYWLFSLTAGSTVLAGLTIPNTPAMFKTSVSLAVVAVNALAALFTSVEGLRKPGDLWIHERTIYHALKDLQREIKYYLSAATIADDAKLDQFFLRMQSILSASLEKWMGTVQPKPLKDGSPPHDNTTPQPPDGASNVEPTS